MLNAIQSHAAKYAEVIARATGLDVEIVDSTLTRVAGTGIYAEGIGQSLDNAGEVCREVMHSKRPLIMEHPRQDKLCQRCAARESCRETLSVSTPILNGGEVLGVMELVCFNQEGRERILASKESYLSFITLLADALGHKVQDQRQLDYATRLLDLMLQIVHANNQGVMIFSDDGRIRYANEHARRMLELPENAVPGFDSSAPGPIPTLFRTGDTLSGLEEFEFRMPGAEERHLMGQLVTLEASLPGYRNALIFEPADDFAHKLGQLAISSDDSGNGLKALIGDSSPLLLLKEKIRAVADSSSTVLISGESGTGKELVARAIHQESPRRDGPFIAINCGGIPDNLLESELFGYVEGAFTGASRKGRMGKFELAHGGVLFLDEISTMPLYLQVKLLRVLQERCIIRLGSNRRVDVDIRIIAATNTDLREEITRGSFREDLFYRLNVIPLETPPLRKRREDIAVLAEYFLRKYCGLFHKAVPHLGQNIVTVLHRHDWPGNVRELEHVMEYAVNMMPPHSPLRPEHLPAHLLAPSPASEVSTSPNDGAPTPDAISESAGAERSEADEVPILPLRELERQAIQAALRRFGRNTEGKRKAADALGLSMATLYRKLRDYAL